MIQTAVIGVGGIGGAVARIMSKKSGFQVVALADKKDLAVNPEGLNVEKVLQIRANKGSLAAVPDFGFESKDCLASLLEKIPNLPALVLCTPSIPHNLVVQQVKRLVDLGFKGAMVDVLDQTGALAQLLPLDEFIQKSKITYVTGAGCTPGLLTAGAALMAHSFIKVLNITIYFGVGIANYLDRDEASLREVLAGVNKMGAEAAAKLTREEILSLLRERNGILEVKGLAHGDDLLLERSGIARRNEVEVGGRVDTTKDKKPVSTRVTVRGITFDGRETEHTLTLGDETSMFANTAGPAIGYLGRAVDFHNKGVFGLFGSTDLMPLFVS